VTSFAGTTGLVQVIPDREMFMFGSNAPRFMPLDGVFCSVNG